MFKRIFRQAWILALIVFLFASFNLGLYFLVTFRLGNNFSSVTQAKMVDVSRYLPHEPDSELVRIHSSLHLETELPVLDGAAALVPVYAAIVENVYPKGSVTYTDGFFSDDNFYGENFAPDSKMQYRNTVRGYQAIVDGTADILFCAAPSREQLEYARQQGVELVLVPVGLEAFVFFVNEDNPVSNLTADQVRSIYSGQITNWSQVGGPSRPINPVTRLAGSGSQSAMEAFMGDVPMGRKPVFALAGGSIGFSFRYYLDGIVGNEQVKMLSLNGVYPNPENIQNGSYPVIAPFYAVYRADNPNPNVKVLIDWLLSEEGQQIIAGSGYVPVP